MRDKLNKGMPAGSSRSCPEIGSAAGGSGQRERRRTAAAGAAGPPVPKGILLFSVFFVGGLLACGWKFGPQPVKIEKFSQKPVHQFIQLCHSELPVQSTGQ
ncbi:MAG: hypothetical protein A2Y02_01115 [Omnitrophica bacterium GWA2_52_12]|nr:MAG: hypothetical protein A2Y02_01115 [Omnitrophica bacterium GWA2_52_12]